MTSETLTEQSQTSKATNASTDRSEYTEAYQLENFIGNESVKVMAEIIADLELETFNDWKKRRAEQILFGSNEAPPTERQEEL